MSAAHEIVKLRNRDFSRAIRTCRSVAPASLWLKQKVGQKTSDLHSPSFLRVSVSPW